MMKFSDERGFGAIEGILILVIVGLVGFVGWYVWHNHAKTTTNSGVYAPPASSNVKTIAKSKTTTVPSLTKYCDSREKACITYDGTWTKKTTTQTGSDGINRTDITLASKAFPGLTIYFRPYITGIGGACTPAFTANVISVKGAAYQRITEFYNDIREVRNGKSIGAIKYGLGMDVAGPNDGTNIKSNSSTICIGLGVYDNPNYKNHEIFGVLDVLFSKKSVASKAEAQAWFESAEVKAAQKVLETLQL